MAGSALISPPPLHPLATAAIATAVCGTILASTFAAAFALGNDASTAALAPLGWFLVTLVLALVAALRCESLVFFALAANGVGAALFGLALAGYLHTSVVLAAYGAMAPPYTALALVVVCSKHQLR